MNKRQYLIELQPCHIILQNMCDTKMFNLLIIVNLDCVAYCKLSKK